MTKTNCKLSIIMPVYNCEKYLEKCLDSLINQTLKDIEIICTNDGSTDDSLNILKKYSEKDSRIKLFESKNDGPSIARNNSIDIANGEYLGFVDSDDWLDLNFFETLYNAAKKNDADIACGSIVKVYPNKTKYFVKYRNLKVAESIDEKIKLSKMRTHNYIWNKIYKKEKIVKNNLKFAEGRCFADIIFTTKVLFYLNKLISVPGVNYYYMHNPSSIVNIVSKKKLEDYKYAIATVKEFACKNGLQLPPNLIMKNWGKYKLFDSIQILKVKEWDYKKEFYLFGFIPILTITKNDYEC